MFSIRRSTIGVGAVLGLVLVQAPVFGQPTGTSAGGAQQPRHDLPRPYRRNQDVPDTRTGPPYVVYFFAIATRDFDLMLTTLPEYRKAAESAGGGPPTLVEKRLSQVKQEFRASFDALANATGPLYLEVADTDPVLWGARTRLLWAARSYQPVGTGPEPGPAFDKIQVAWVQLDYDCGQLLQYNDPRPISQLTVAIPMDMPPSPMSLGTRAVNVAFKVLRDSIEYCTSGAPNLGPPSAATPTPTLKAVDLAGNWIAKVDDPQGGGYIQFRLERGGPSYSGHAEIGSPGSPKKFPGTINLKLEGDRVTGGIRYSFKRVLKTCQSTIRIEATLKTDSTIVGRTSEESGCAARPQPGTIQIKRQP